MRQSRNESSQDTNDNDVDLDIDAVDEQTALTSNNNGDFRTISMETPNNTSATPHAPPNNTYLANLRHGRNNNNINNINNNLNNTNSRMRLISTDPDNCYEDDDENTHSQSPSKTIKNGPNHQNTSNISKTDDPNDPTPSESAHTTLSNGSNASATDQKENASESPKDTFNDDPNDPNPNGTTTGKYYGEGDDFPIFGPFDGPYPWWVYKKDWLQVKNEILVGLVVGCGQVPESIAFAFLAGLDDATIGLHAAWIIGLIVSLTGNRPALISGATGAMAVILKDPIKEYGVKFLFYTVIFKGVIQTAVSFMGFERIANLVPFTTNLGFVNGLAIIIGKAQIDNFKLDDEFVEGEKLLAMIILSLITFAIIETLPRFFKAVPSSLVAICITTFIEHVILRQLDITETILIGDKSSLSGGFPKLIFSDSKYKDDLPSLFEAETWEIITPPAILTALVAMIECTMTIEVIDDLTQTPHHPVTQQLASAGIANFVSGFFGTMGGGATIPLSMIAVHSGANGRYRISGVVAALFMLTTILVASPLLEQVPSAALIGVMMVAVLRTFQFQSVWIVLLSLMPLKMRSWLANKVSSFKKFENFTTNKKINRADAFVIVIVTILTLVFDLAIAVVCGVLVSSFCYVWQHSTQCTITSQMVPTLHKKIEKSMNNNKKENINGEEDVDKDDENDENVKIYFVDGPLFFGNAHWLRKQFDYKNDPKCVEIHMTDAHIYDYSAMQALNFVGEKYKKFDKKLKLKNINKSSTKLITKAKDLFLHFEYEEIMAVETNRNLTLMDPDRLKMS